MIINAPTEFNPNRRALSAACFHRSGTRSTCRYTIGMPKSEYTIDGRHFHVERLGKGWVGWFIDDPERRFAGPLKMDVLCEAGYAIPGGGGIIFASGTSIRRYAPRRSMQDAYAAFRAKLAAGHRPKFRDDQPLSNFIIFARDEFRCLYCGCLCECPTLDHVCPVSCNGDDTAANIATCCRACNSRKRNSRLPDESDRLAELRRRNAAYGIRDHLVVIDAVRPDLEMCVVDDPYAADGECTP